MPHQAVLALVSGSEVGWLSYIASDVMYALAYAYVLRWIGHAVSHDKIELCDGTSPSHPSAPLPQTLHARLGGYASIAERSRNCQDSEADSETSPHAVKQGYSSPPPSTCLAPAHHTSRLGPPMCAE